MRRCVTSKTRRREQCCARTCLEFGRKTIRDVNSHRKLSVRVGAVYVKGRNPADCDKSNPQPCDWNLQRQIRVVKTHEERVLASRIHVVCGVSGSAAGQGLWQVLVFNHGTIPPLRLKDEYRYSFGKSHAYFVQRLPSSKPKFVVVSPMLVR